MLFRSLKTVDSSGVVGSPVFRWAPDGASLVYLDARAGFDLMSQPLTGGPAKKLVAAEGNRIFMFDVSRTGRGFAMARGSETSDAVMITNFR